MTRFILRFTLLNLLFSVTKHWHLRLGAPSVGQLFFTLKCPFTHSFFYTFMFDPSLWRSQLFAHNWIRIGSGSTCEQQQFKGGSTLLKTSNLPIAARCSLSSLERFLFYPFANWGEFYFNFFANQRSIQFSFLPVGEHSIFFFFTSLRAFHFLFLPVRVHFILSFFANWGAFYF